MPGGAKQPCLDCREIAADKRLVPASLLTFAVIRLAPQSSGRTPAQRFKHRLIGILLLADEAREFGKRIVVPLDRGERLAQTPFELLQIEYRRSFYNWLAHLTHPPVATSWRTNSPIHVITIAHPTLGTVYAISRAWGHAPNSSTSLHSAITIGFHAIHVARLVFAFATCTRAACLASLQYLTFKHFRRLGRRAASGTLTQRR